MPKKLVIYLRLKNAKPFFKRYGFLFVFLFFSLFNLEVWGDSKEIYSFPNQEQTHRFYHLAQQLRCLVCQNETLLDSNAPLAKDLRSKIETMILSGKSDAEIRTYLVARYGDFILYKPALNEKNFMLWASPFLFLSLGFFIFFLMCRKKEIKCL